MKLSSSATVAHPQPALAAGHDDQRAATRRVIAAYDTPIVRAYCFVRFLIININMLHILALCLRGKTRVLEIGCGFGWFACHFASRWPGIQYHGIDVNAARIDMATRAASRLGLDNVTFECADASKPLVLDGTYDAVVMLDLLHHLPDDAKRSLLDTVQAALRPGGHLVIKEITPRPRWKLWFTWALDVFMTKGFDMWYWRPDEFRQAIPQAFDLESYPIVDWLPYPHIVYLFSKPRDGAA